MFNKFMEDKLRLWQVQINSKNKGHYVDSHTLHATGKTVEDVIAKIKEKYPDSKIVSINHKAAIEL